MTASKQRKVAFITGASSGIGRATAEAMIGRGYAVVLVDRQADQGRQVQEQLSKSGDCIFIACDVRDDQNVADAVQQAVKTYGRLDVAFNAAGIDSDQAPTADCEIANWNNTLAINLTGVWFCMRHQLQQMLKQGGGAIVNCASTAGIAGAVNVPAYVASKHGVVGLTKAAALEYARKGIRVNAVCPGMTDTPMWHRAYSPEAQKVLIPLSPIGRMALPAEIASAVLWLCDDSASYVTGQAIAVDGGLMAS